MHFALIRRERRQTVLCELGGGVRCDGVRDEAGGGAGWRATSDLSVALNKTTEIDTGEEEESPGAGWGWGCVI